MRLILWAALLILALPAQADWAHRSTGTGCVDIGTTLEVTCSVPTHQAGDELFFMLATRDGDLCESIADWTLVAEYVIGEHEHRIFGRSAPSNATPSPTCTGSGDVAGSSMLGQVVAFSGGTFEHSVERTTASDFSPDSDVEYPAITPVDDNTLVLVLGSMHNDALGMFSVPMGFSSLGQVDDDTGNDQSMVARYQIQTTATAVPAGVITDPGGATANTFAMTLSLKAAESSGNVALVIFRQLELTQ